MDVVMKSVKGKPNILLILSDQHSGNIAGFNGNQIVDTKALDALAQQGVQFGAAYCQAPQCIPSRLSLLTGRYPHRCGAWDNEAQLSEEYQTIPKWLGNHGYATAAVGKMHFRGIEQNHGFQHRPFGDLVASKIDLHQPDPPSTADGRSTDHAVGRFPFAGPSVIPESLHSDTIVTRESLAWASEFSDENPEVPWFLCTSYFRPHFPLTAPGRYVRKYQNRELPKLKPPDNLDHLHPHDRFIVEDFGLQHFSEDEHRNALTAYYASVDYVDDQVRELLAGFQRNGLLDNTFVIYSADHGEMAGEHGLWWKRSYYQASAAVPLLIAGPGIPPGTRVEEPVELTDLFPTFCSWAGIEPPNGLDGETLGPLIDGCSDLRRKTYAISQILGGAKETRFRMVRDQRWKRIEFPAAPPRLFDLQNDPGETQDLAKSHIDKNLDLPLNEIFESFDDWDSLDHARENDEKHKKLPKTTSRAAIHYRLPDGRVVDADDHLYDGSSVEE